jgi:hypothetical protein
MKLKSLLIVTLLFFAANTHAQWATSVFLNGIKSGDYNIKEGQTDGGIWYKKSVYKTMERLSIEVKGKDINNTMYKRTVEVVDDKAKSLLVAPETEGLPGQFVLTDKGIQKRLAKGKMVKLYLQLDPANASSKAPSKRYFIGNLTAK